LTAGSARDILLTQASFPGCGLADLSIHPAAMKKEAVEGQVWEEIEDQKCLWAFDNIEQMCYTGPARPMEDGSCSKKA
jgi:hypothetical protein